MSDPEGEIALLRLRVDHLETITNDIHNRIEEAGKPNYLLWTSFLSSIALVLGAIWLVVGLKIDSSSQPISTKVAELDHTVNITRSEQIKRIDETLIAMEARRISEMSAISTRIARLSVWMDFVHGKVFPDIAVPLQQPPP